MLMQPEMCCTSLLFKAHIRRTILLRHGLRVCFWCMGRVQRLRTWYAPLAAVCMPQSVPAGDPRQTAAPSAIHPPNATEPPGWQCQLIFFLSETSYPLFKPQGMYTSIRRSRCMPTQPCSPATCSCSSSSPHAVQQITHQPMHGSPGPRRQLIRMHTVTCMTALSR